MRSSVERQPTKILSNISNSIMPKSTPTQSNGKGGSQEANWQSILEFHFFGEVSEYKLKRMIEICAKKKRTPQLQDYILRYIFSALMIHQPSRQEQSIFIRKVDIIPLQPREKTRFNPALVDQPHATKR